MRHKIITFYNLHRINKYTTRYQQMDFDSRTQSTLIYFTITVQVHRKEHWLEYEQKNYKLHMLDQWKTINKNSRLTCSHSSTDNPSAICIWWSKTFNSFVRLSRETKWRSFFERMDIISLTSTLRSVRGRASHSDSSRSSLKISALPQKSSKNSQKFARVVSTKFKVIFSPWKMKIKTCEVKYSAAFLY